MKQELGQPALVAGGLMQLRCDISIRLDDSLHLRAWRRVISGLWDGVYRVRAQFTGISLTEDDSA